MHRWKPVPAGMFRMAAARGVPCAAGACAVDRGGSTARSEVQQSEARHSHITPFRTTWRRCGWRSTALLQASRDRCEDGIFAQSPAIAASMLAGESQFAMVGQDVVINADLNGGDIVISPGSEKAAILDLRVGEHPRRREPARQEDRRHAVRHHDRLHGALYLEESRIAARRRHHPSDGTGDECFRRPDQRVIDVCVLGSDAVFRARSSYSSMKLRTCSTTT